MTRSISISYSPSWKAVFPGAAMGMLFAENAPNRSPLPSEMESLRLEKEQNLKERYGSLSRKDLAALPALAPYAAYYKERKSTYHVLQQIESIAQGKRTIPAPSCHVLAMFMAELESGLLTAGHDVHALGERITVDTTREGDSYTMLSGKEAQLSPGDMCIRDERGILSSILKGPNRESPIGDDTKDLLFTVYAPRGISPARVEAHLRNIEKTLGLYAPERKIRFLEVFENPSEN